MRNWRSKPSFITMQRLDTKMLRRLGGEAATPAPSALPVVAIRPPPDGKRPARSIAMRGVGMLFAGVIVGLAIGRFVIASEPAPPAPVSDVAPTSALAPPAEPAAASAAPSAPLPVADEKPARPHRRRPK